MMVHIRYNIGKVFLCILLVIVFVFSMSSIYAVDVGSYKGKYDLKKPHKVNTLYNPRKGINNEEEIEKILQTCYQQFRAWGITAEGSSAIIGNLKAEGCGGTDTTQNWVDWDNFVYGVTGIGLMGFTHYSVQEKLFDIAAKEGKQWTDLGVQLQTIKEYYFPLDDRYYKKGHTVQELADYFCATYEKPAINNFADREKHALEYHGKFKDLKPKDYDGSLSMDKANSAESADPIAGLKITAEWDLVGMPTKSGLAANIRIPTLAKRDNLTIAESDNLVQIRDSIAQSKQFNTWTTARVILVFLGLVLMVYTLLLTLAVLFDNWNNFINISLVSLMTLGKIKYSICAEEELDGEKYTGTKRMIILLIVMFIVSCIFISGGVIPVVMQSIYGITEIIVGWL